MTKHPNHHEATNTTCTKDIHSLYKPAKTTNTSSSTDKKTLITYTTSISEKFQLQEPLQTTHSKTIQPSTDTTTATTIKPDSSIHTTIPTDTRTLHTASILYTSFSTIPTTILHCIEAREQKIQVI